MRKTLMGLLLAATAVSPALADKGDHGHGGGEKHGEGRGGGEDHGGGWKHGGREDRDEGWKHRGGDEDRGGGWKHAEWNRGGGRDWGRKAEFYAPYRMARYGDRQARKVWKREWKEERHDRRDWAREERYRPTERWARAPVRYYEPQPVYRPSLRYEEPVVRYAAPVQSSAQPSYGYYDQPSYDSYAQPGYASNGDYWPSNYVAPETGYGSYADSLFGSGGSSGLLSGLLPVLLQSGLGGLGGLSELGGLSGVGGLTGLGSDVNVLPIEQASYAPYVSGNSDLTSQLLPALLGNTASIF